MTLDKNLVATRWVVLTLEEVVEANFVQRGRRSESRDVSADTDARALCAVNQHCGVPTHPGAIGSLYFFVTRELSLILWSDGVDVVGGRNHRHVQLKLV